MAVATGAVQEGDDAPARIFAVNAGGVPHLPRAVVRRMTPRESGPVIATGSGVAGVPQAGRPVRAAPGADRGTALRL
ncbi:NADP-dependent 3-hydroxy acid dehydrogenase YdfG [Streptosporangium becharense]|uniref:NADP-dependent 3-hydroxy acid dehydrogenase YdfG n=1 Tax=Streptosporangium becharense TaxID=1816182 RepID=A0A7W9IGW0_9ACTN|nr:hypothetical protein [Streptosporangium becharense]MBB2908941.1 NADP-dependent 3-hydroxy acid dehydrogenase YdfG [Streptosporangium becharense]MBB5820041.1 NADP-dependent 3-hydroxy acid dehydrogenase YdfG [Streptosporangium becharense]